MSTIGLAYPYLPQKRLILPQTKFRGETKGLERSPKTQALESSQKNGGFKELLKRGVERTLLPPQIWLINQLAKIARPYVSGRFTLSSARGREVAAHELGHSIAGFASGKKKQHIFLGVLPKKPGFVVNHSYFTLHSREDYFSRLVTLLSGYRFQSVWNTDNSQKVSQGILIIQACSDINKIRKLLMKGKQQGVFYLEDKLDLSPLPVKRFDVIHQSVKRRGTPLTEAEKAELKPLLNQLMDTLDIPLVQQAMKVSDQLIQAIPFPIFTDMLNEALEKKIILTTEVEDFYNRHLPPKIQNRLEAIMKNFTQGSNG